MPKKNNDASEIPALEREIWSKKNVPVALAAYQRAYREANKDKVVSV